MHSVFDNTVNITAAGRLLSVVNKKYFNGPGRIVVDSFFNLEKRPIINECVKIESGRMLFSGGLMLDFGNSRRWHTGIRKIDINKIDTEVVSSYLDNYSFVKPAASVGLKTALKLKDAKLLNSTVDGLIGLGFGLTPSGDDFLVGFLSASHFFSGIPQFNFFLKSVKLEYTKTNFISAEYLRYSYEGNISEVITNTVISISQNSPAACFWLSNLVSLGATSGKDTLFGILTAMEVYNACKSC